MTKNPIKIFLVDDELEILTVLKAGLERQGFEVDAFTNPITALQHYEPNIYDRIITDIRMPAMSGFEFARQLWAIDTQANVYFTSSFEINESARKMFPNLKSYCFIKKPFAATVLAKHVEAHVG